MKRFLQTFSLVQRAGLSVAAIAYSLCAALSVSIVMPFVNIIFADNILSFPGISIPAIPSKYRALLLLCALTWIIFLLKNTLYYLTSRMKVRMEIVLAQRLRTECLRQLFRRDLNYFHATGVSDMSVQLIQTIDAIAERTVGAILAFSKNSALLLLYASILIAISWKLMLASLIAVPIVSWMALRIRNRTVRHIESDQSAMMRLAHDVQQKFFAIKLIKLFNSEAYETEKFQRKSQSWSLVRSERAKAEALNYVFIEMLGVSLGVLLLYLVGMENINGYFDYGPGGLVLFIAAVFSMIDPAKEFHEALRRRSEAGALWTNLNHPPHVPRQERMDQTTVHKFECLEFNDVSFQYPHNRNAVIQHASFQIRRGEKIILAGKSGSGKSTLIDLMTGLQPPAEGIITINGIDMQRIPQCDKARIFGIITQEPLLFNDTLYQNIGYNLPNVTEQQVADALKLVQADHLAVQRKGIHTVIGERGNTLSGGEKQRVALARMVLRDPEVLILDEATSALGEAMERDILNTIFKIFAERTILIIAHRPSVWALAERVMEIRRHRILERTGEHSLALEKYSA